MGIKRSVQHESCSFMGLNYALEISAHLFQYNVIYGLLSANTPVVDSLCCGYLFMWILVDFGDVMNMKVVDNLLKQLLLKFQNLWLRDRVVSCLIKIV